MPVVYVAGPFRAPAPWGVEQNIRAAESAAIVVAELGAIPVCPHTMYRFFDKSLPDKFRLGAGLRLVDMCDAMVLLGLWSESRGAVRENARAKALGMPRFFWAEGPTALARWVKAIRRG